MISDVLFQAVQDIKRYPGSLVDKDVAAVVAAMDELRAYRDCYWGQPDFPETVAEFVAADATKFLKGLVNPVGTVREALAVLRANPDAYGLTDEAKATENHNERFLKLFPGLGAEGDKPLTTWPHDPDVPLVGESVELEPVAKAAVEGPSAVDVPKVVAELEVAMRDAEQFGKMAAEIVRETGGLDELNYWFGWYSGKYDAHQRDLNLLRGESPKPAAV